MQELPIIQKTYDFVKWYVPILNRLPRTHRFGLGDRLTNHLYDLLEGLLTARYSSDKLALLEALKGKLDILQYQTRLLLDFDLISIERYEYASTFLADIGSNLGGWVKQQRQKEQLQPHASK